MSGSRSGLYLLSSSWSKNSAQGRAVSEYVYPAGKLTVWECSAPEVLQIGAGGMRGRDGIRSGVRCLCRSGGGAPVCFRLQRVWWFFARPFWQGRQLDVWFWRRITRCLCIAVFTFLCPGHSTPRFFSSWTLALLWGCIPWVTCPSIRRYYVLRSTAVDPIPCSNYLLL